MTSSPDPIGAPHAYQRHLLDRLGDDDPAAVQEATIGELGRLVAEAGSRLRVSPGAGEWSVLGCIAHLVDAEVVMSGRYRWILAHDQPELLGYDQDLWVDQLHPADEEVGELLALFNPLRRANLELWRKTSPSQRSRVGIHRERGPESFDLSFRMIAGHDRLHLDQARRAMEAAPEG
jgi:hypothetical protein